MLVFTGEIKCLFVFDDANTHVTLDGCNDIDNISGYIYELHMDNKCVSKMEISKEQLLKCNDCDKLMQLRIVELLNGARAVLDAKGCIDKEFTADITEEDNGNKLLVTFTEVIS